TNAFTGDVTVNFATSNGTAIAGIDYGATNGLLTFSNGVTLQSFVVPIINNRLVQGDRTFTVSLSNPGNGALVIPPSITTITITDDVSGIPFSSPTYTIKETGGAATITVFRNNYPNSYTAVDFTTGDGTGLANANYVPNHGTLSFTNGETVK